MTTRNLARPRALVASFVAVTTFMLTAVLWPSPVLAAAPCPVPGNVEIDGDMTQATCTPAADDWNTPGLGVATTTQGGTYSTSGKDDDDPSGWSSSGSTPDKTNFARVYGVTRVVGGHYYAYVAWERTGASGTQGYAIEIDNAQPRVGAGNTPQPDRSNGGVVVYISSQGGGAPAFDEACTFTTQSTYGSTCTNSNGSITAAINTISMNDPLAGTTQAAGTFFEVAIDVTGLTGIVPTCPGATAASGYIRSVTGQTHNGNLKGYMAPLTLQPDSTCVAPPISTTATPGGALNPIGTAQHDSVVVGTGAAPGAGTVDFFLCQPADVTAGGCASGGTKVGLTKTLDGTGSASSDVIDGATTPDDTTPGTYCWRAEFTPGENDHNYLPGTHTNATTECFTIAHATPSIPTQVAVTGDDAPGLGLTSLGDTAQLTGFVGTVTGENVGFALYGPFGATIPATCTAAPAIFTTTGTLDASGHATTAQTFTPTQPGQYVWIASYAGDSLNDAVSGGCADANEHATIVSAQVGIVKSANPAGPVSAGASIGFDLTVSNTAPVPATGVHVHDALPSGADGASSGDLDWALVPDYSGCAISGDVGSEVLDCDFAQVGAAASLPAIHVQSSTTQTECGEVDNQASVTTTNGTGSDSEIASVTVLCPDLAITKTADADAVNSGTAIGFTIEATNSGPGTAFAAVIQDPLPAHAGVTWSVSPDYAGPGTCSIAGPDQQQVLTCLLGDFPAGGDATVHVVSDTTDASCGDYDNTAQLLSGNAATVEASATTTVNCAGVEAEVPPETPPLAATGAGPLHGEFDWALWLVFAGTLLTVVARRRSARG